MFTNNISRLSFILIFFIITACAASNKTVKLEEFKSNLNCIEYNNGMRWIEIESKFGEPDYTPIPTGNSLSENTRIYKGKCIIFYTGPNKIRVEGKTRYEEVITKIEICDNK